MPNGTLKLYNKLTNALLVSLDILGTFNIEDNLNETPSNMKVKVITSNTYREEFEVNTVAYHEDTDSWWVIKSDESTYLMTGEYEHEIQLVEYLEFYAYRHLPNCAFAPNTYDLEDMLNRLFNIAKLSISINYPNFLDKDKIMPFFSFENFTVANAIKNISRAINAIPKMSINLAGFVPTLTFVNRNGLDNAIVETLNTQFPIAYEKNMNSNDQFTTRSVSNITNAKSSSLVIAPLNGGFKNIVPNSIVFDSTTREQARVYAPSKIDRIEYIKVIVPVRLVLDEVVVYTGYYLDRQVFENLIDASSMTSTQKTIAKANLPNVESFYKVNYNDSIDKNYFSLTSDDGRANIFYKKMNLLNKFEFDTASRIVGGNTEVDTDKKERTIHWTPFSNEIVMPKSFRDGLTDGNDHNPFYYLFDEDPSDPSDSFLRYRIETQRIGGVIYNESVLVQIAYYPIADIKVSIDNDNDAQDEKFFNQSGKVIDAVSVSKLITSHTNDSVEGTKIRNAKYTNLFSYFVLNEPFSMTSGSPDTSASDGTYWFSLTAMQLYKRVSGSWVVVPSTNGTITPTLPEQENLLFVNTATSQLFISQKSILPLGQLVRDNNQIYIVTQRSIDGHIKNGNEYYNVIYTLARNRISRSENIVADSSVISYKTPDDNLVFRSQLYKDYIELSLVNITPKDTPYLSMSKALVLSNTLAGTNFDYTTLVKNSFGTTPTTVRYVKSPTIFDLHKSKLMNVNWQDNNVIGFRFDRTINGLIQTPILYTDNLGKATNFELLFMNTQEINQANSDFNSPTVTDALVPFGDLTTVPTSFYNDDVLTDIRYSIRINEFNYDKDPFEIPVFEYMIQGNDDYNPLGNIVIGNDLFTTLSGNIRYHYVINNSTRFTAENANRLYLANPPGNLTNRRAGLSRPSGTQIQMVLYSTFDPNASPFAILTQNTSSVTNVGIYAVDGNTGTIKFLFAINDYTMASVSTFNIFINNWKI
jgi:hypothetical protein